MKSIALFLISIFTFAGLSKAQQTPPQVPDYIRYRPATAQGEPDILETAISRFEKGTHVIDLIAVVHLGDRAYFEKLETTLTGYDAVLYEMVGGPYTREKAEQQARLKANPPDFASEGIGLKPIGELQAMAGKLFDLSFQLDQLDYLAPNFVHADMTEQELAQQSVDGDGDLANLLTRAMTMAQSGKLKGVPLNETEANQFMMRFLRAIMVGNSHGLKRALGPILAESETFLQALEDGEESVLISKRNEIAIDKIKSLPAKASRRDAVLYGAGHMPDLEKRLVQMGFQKTDTSWHPGWTIPAGDIANPGALGLEEMKKMLGNLLQSPKDASGSGE